MKLKLMPVTITLEEQRAFKLFMKHPEGLIGCNRFKDPQRWNLYRSLQNKQYINFVETVDDIDFFALKTPE